MNYLRKSNHPTREKATRGEIFLSSRRVLPFLAWSDFRARSRFARSTIPEEKWGTTRSLLTRRLQELKFLFAILVASSSDSFAKRCTISDSHYSGARNDGFPLIYFENTF